MVLLRANSITSPKKDLCLSDQPPKLQFKLNMTEEKFHLTVSSREGVVYEANVTAITSYNETGKFDILAQHANFISLITKGIEIKEDEKVREKTISFDNALIRVRENSVEVYIAIKDINTQQII